MKDHCGHFRLWKSRGQDTALPNWDLVSTWLLILWMQSERSTRTFKSNIILHWWRLRQWMYCVFPSGQKTFWAFRVDMQGARASPKWGESARITHQRRETSLEERQWCSYVAIKQHATSVSAGWDDKVLTWEACWLKPWLEWLKTIQCKEIGVSTGINSVWWMPAHLLWELPLKLTVPSWKMLVGFGRKMTQDT